MKRFFTTIAFSLTLSMSVVGVFPLAVNAESSPSQTSSETGQPSSSGAQVQPTVTDSILNQAKKGEEDSSSAGKPMSFVGETFNSAFVSVMVAIMTLFAWLLGVAMVLLDNTILYTVVYMGACIKNLAAIGITWEILRNIGNILLIFGFLAIGIGTILNIEWYGGKKMILRLIMGAILINFSLFMTEAVIDVGNFLATRIYTQINGGIAAGVKLTDSSSASFIDSVKATTGSISNEAVSSKIMNQLGLQTIYGKALNGDKNLLSNNNSPLVAFLGILLFIILAFVMFFLSFILISRFVYLIYAIIVSPVGVVGWVMPNFQAFGSKWLHELFTQSMTAPVMLLLLYVALRIITDPGFLGFGSASPDYAGAFADKNGNFNLAGFANVLISFFVAIGSLLAVVYGTKKFGAFGSDWASKMAGKVSFGIPAWAGRSTAGLASHNLARFVRTSRLGSTKTGMLVSTGLDKVATGSIDIRGSKWAASGLKTIGIDAGKPQEGGYRGARAEAIKKFKGQVKAIDEAFDEKHGAETARLAKARGAAEKNLKGVDEESVKLQVAPLEKERDELAKQKKQLEKQVEENKNSTDTGPEKTKRDRETIEKLEKTKAAFDAADNQIKEITKSIAQLKEAKKAEGDLKKAVANQKNESKQRYAHNMGEGFTSWFRLGARDAANQIVKETFKKQDDKLKEIERILGIKPEKAKDAVPKEEKSKEGESAEKAKS